MVESNKLLNIRIVAIPPGEAPESIRAQWMGLELPLAAGRPGVYQVRTFGAISGSADDDKAIGYCVAVKDAIAELDLRTPVAADWWRANAPQLFEGDRHFLFYEDCCELIALDDE